jgi:hypothetical protein
LATEIPSREMQTYTYAEKKEPNEQKYKLLGHEIERVGEEKDIEVTIDEELTFEKHVQEKNQ